MAVIFELWAECDDETSLQKLKEHFDRLKYTLLTGRTIEFRAWIENDYVRGLSVWSSGICGNGRGIESLKDALEATEAGFFLYHRLKTAPDFSFAHIGWDAENYAGIDLSDYVYTAKDGSNHWSGFDCVLNDELYKQLGSPSGFQQFREGYWYRKYWGESYEPLFGTDQHELRELCQRLLPENFD